MLIFTIQQSDSFIHIYTFFFIFFSIMVYHRILNMAPCARGTLLSSHSLYNSLHLLILNSQSTLPPPSPHLLGNYSPVLYVCESVSITQISHSCHILDSTYKWYHMVLSFWLISLGMIISRSSHLAASGIISFFLRLSSIPFIYVLYLLYPSLLMDI